MKKIYLLISFLFLLNNLISQVQFKIEILDSRSELFIDGVDVVILNNITNDTLSQVTNNSGVCVFKLFTDSILNLEIKLEKEGYFPKMVDFKYQVGEKKDTVLCKEFITEIDKSVTTHTDTRFFRAQTIRFKKNSFELLNDLKIKLDGLIAGLKDYPQMNLEFQGHSSCNEKEGIAQKRVEAVMNYLLTNGIESSRIKIESVGNKEPIYICEDCKNCPEEEQKQNRRVEFQVWK